MTYCTCPWTKSLPRGFLIILHHGRAWKLLGNMASLLRRSQTKSDESDVSIRIWWRYLVQAYHLWFISSDLNIWLCFVFVRIFRSAQIPLNIDFKEYCKLRIPITISWLFHVYLVTACKEIKFWWRLVQNSWSYRPNQFLLKFNFLFPEIFAFDRRQDIYSKIQNKS